MRLLCRHPTFASLSFVCSRLSTLPGPYLSCSFLQLDQKGPSIPRRIPRGRTNDLHRAAAEGSTERTVDSLSDGIGVDEADPAGRTPLMLAAENGYARVVRILLQRKADRSVADDGGSTALHTSAENGHLAVTKMLLKAAGPGPGPRPPNLEALDAGGFTPLHLAAYAGRSKVVKALVEAGADPDARASDRRQTPLHFAAAEGHVGAVRELLAANADPLLPRHHPTLLPFNAAVNGGHSELVREMIRSLGIKGCFIGGSSSGMVPLCLAARHPSADILAVLLDAGVDDKGVALNEASGQGSEACVRFLLRRREEEWNDMIGSRLILTARMAAWEYLENTADVDVEAPGDAAGRTPLLRSVTARTRPSPRIVRMLVDAGANTTSAIALKNRAGEVTCTTTPLDLTIRRLQEERAAAAAGAGAGAAAAAEGENKTVVHGLEAIRRLLLQVAAARAISWAWPNPKIPIIGAQHAKTTFLASKRGLVSVPPVVNQRGNRRGCGRLAIVRRTAEARHRRPNLMPTLFRCEKYLAERMYVCVYVYICGFSILEFRAYCSVSFSARPWSTLLFTYLFTLVSSCMPPRLLCVACAVWTYMCD